MLAAQRSSIDMLMLYDARPSAWCSLFKPYVNSSPLKSYYSLYMFNKLYRGGTEYESTVDGENLYAIASSDSDTRYLMLTHYNDDDETPAEDVTLSFKDAGFEGGARLEFYALNEDRSCELVKSEIFKSDSLECVVGLPLYTTYLVKITKA